VMIMFKESRIVVCSGEIYLGALSMLWEDCEDVGVKKMWCLDLRLKKVTSLDGFFSFSFSFFSFKLSGRLLNFARLGITNQG